MDVKFIADTENNRLGPAKSLFVLFAIQVLIKNISYSHCFQNNKTIVCKDIFHRQTTRSHIGTNWAIGKITPNTFVRAQ